MSSDGQIHQIARDIVSTVAPEEMNGFESTSQAFLRDQKRVRRGRGDTALSFGSGEIVALITPAALVVAAAVVDNLAERAGSAVVQRGFSTARWLYGKFGRADPVTLPEVPPLALDDNELLQIRRLAEEKARALGLPEDRVQLLVDALMCSLTKGNDEIEES